MAGSACQAYLCSSGHGTVLVLGPFGGIYHCDDLALFSVPVGLPGCSPLGALTGLIVVCGDNLLYSLCCQACLSVLGGSVLHSLLYKTRS